MHLFSVFLPIRIRSISDRYQDHRFPILGEIKRFFAKRRIEIANPTSPQALLCGCQTQMFHCNGDIQLRPTMKVQGRKNLSGFPRPDAISNLYWSSVQMLLLPVKSIRKFATAISVSKSVAVTRKQSLPLQECF